MQQAWEMWTRSGNQYIIFVLKVIWAYFFQMENEIWKGWMENIINRQKCYDWNVNQVGQKYSCYESFGAMWILETIVPNTCGSKLSF